MTSGQVRLGIAPTRTAGRASKVPVIVTALFWVTKVLTTGMGETTSDFLAHRLGPVPAVGLSGVALVGALLAQFAVRRYVAAVYWLAVVMVSVFGTVAADVVHVGFGVPYAVSTVTFAVALAVVFSAWWRSQRTLSIHSIVTRRRELFYWATVLTTFALGTAAGDLTATTLRLGYFASGVLFTVVIAVPAVAYRSGRMNGVLAFWFAYVLTRPVGASFADWLGVPASRHGLGLGTGSVSLALAGIIAVLVGYLTVTGRDARATPVGERPAG
jgi:uncharacterized membrane-anchored protein